MKMFGLLSVLPAAQALFFPRAVDTTSLDTMSLDIPVPVPPEAPPTPEIILTRFTRSVWGGSGCPPRKSPSEDRTQTFRIDEDGRLEYSFTSLDASTDPELHDEGAEGEAECMVLVSIAGIPPGWAFRVTDVWARGYTSLTAGTVARINSSLSLGEEGDLLGVVQLSNLSPPDAEPVSSRFMAQLLEVGWQNQLAATTQCVLEGSGVASLNLTLSVEAISAVVPVEEGTVGVEAVDIGGALWQCAS